VKRSTESGCPNEIVARGVDKAVLNSPLVKTAICGNDPNVGRMIMAIGKHLGAHHPGLDLSALRVWLGGQIIYELGALRLDPAKDAAMVEHLRATELYPSAPPDGTTFRPPVDYPPHERAAELAIDLALGPCDASALGADLTHEYISENADYRS